MTIPGIPRRVAYALQLKTSQGEVPVDVDVDETLEQCNSFVLVPKANGKVWLCLELARHNKALIRPV